MLNGKYHDKTLVRVPTYGNFRAVRSGKMSMTTLQAESGMSRSRGTWAMNHSQCESMEGLGIAHNALPAVDARANLGTHIGRRIVEMVEDITLALLDKRSFENAIMLNAAIGGSTSHNPLTGIAGRLGIDLKLEDFQRLIGRSTAHQSDAISSV